MSRYKKAPLPSNLKSIPKGIVYLGMGRGFKTFENDRLFEGYVLQKDEKWSCAFISNYRGGDWGSYYFAPADSEIARLNGIKPRIRKKKTAPPVTIQDVWTAFQAYTKQSGNHNYSLVLFNNGSGVIENYADGKVLNFDNLNHALLIINDPTKRWVDKGS